MPRARRPHADDDIHVPDPADFADRYCCQRGLLAADLVGLSEAEKDCIRHAELARAAYKSHRDGELERRFDDPSSERSLSPRAVRRRPPPIADDPGLTPAQKYARRLLNNRKSAAASKVYAEVLKREMATKLHQFSKRPDGADAYEARIRELEDERIRLITRLSELNGAVVDEKKRAADFERDIVRRKCRRISYASDYDRLRTVLASSSHPMYTNSNSKPMSTRIKNDDYNLIDEAHQLQMSSQEMAMVNDHMGSQNHLAPATNTQQSYAFSQPSATAYLNDHIPSQPPLSQGESRAPPDGPSQTTSNDPPLVVQKWPDSMALSSLGNDADAKDFTTGMTCTQSQEVDRPRSLPMSSGPPINNLISASQLSQRSQELANFKGVIGSEENPVADPNFFDLNSQGNPKSNAN